MAVINGTSGNDDLKGTSREDTILGHAGNDKLHGKCGDDVLDGGDGNDSLVGGGDNDELNGGDGADTIVIDTLGSNGVNTTTANGGSGGEDNDTLDISGLIAEGWTVANHVQNPESNGTPGYDGQIQLVKDGQYANINYTDIENVVICFTPGTMIATPTGEHPVESLREGDRVFTRDNGVQEVRWVGNRTLTGAELQTDPALRPVRIKAGSLGHNIPERDMLVSPSHRMLIANERTAMYFDEREVLAAAKHLTKLQGISKVNPSRGVSYHHILFDRHEVVLGNGAWTESFQPGDYSLGGMKSDQRDEIVRLFPTLASVLGRDAYAAARRTLKRQESELLAG